MNPSTVRITVVKKTVNREFVEAKRRHSRLSQGCCNTFKLGHGWITDGQIPKGIPGWA